MVGIKKRYPYLIEILGEEFLSEELERFVTERGPWFLQLESDLEYLARFLEKGKLISCFRDRLRNIRQGLPLIYEIYVDALLASISQEIELHVPTPGSTKKTFDFKVKIQDCEINGEVKTRKDDFPFTTRPLQTPKPGVSLYEATRATIDRAVLEELPGFSSNQNVDISTPESKVLRELLEEGLGQLPLYGKNIIVLGQIEGHIEDLEDALYGDEYIELIKKRDGKSICRFPRARNGIFSSREGFKDFNRLNAVIWLKLNTQGYTITRESRIFFNPFALEPLPLEVEEILIKAFDRKEYLERELETIKGRIITHYSPEKIFLFGSLVHGRLHEGSDLDLVIVKETDKGFIERCVEVTKITQPRVGVNFFVYTPKEFECMQKEWNFFIIEEVIGKGRLIYDQAQEVA